MVETPGAPPLSVYLGYSMCWLHQEVRENSKSNEAIVEVTRAGKKGPLQPTLSIRIRKG